MQPIANYQSDDSRLRLLLQGAPGTGKTTLACHLPGVYVADLDINLGGPLRYMKEKGLALPSGYDIIDREENGNEVPQKLRYSRLAKCIMQACLDPAVKTIVIDSATKLADYMLDEVLRQQNKTQMDRQMWGFYFTLWKHFISQITAAKKHCVLICHEKVEKDEIDQTLKYFINIPGQIKDIIGSLFTDVWRCEVASTGGISPTYKWNIRTMPDHKFQLKNSLGLPPVFEFKWETVEAKLKTMTTL